MKAFRLKVLLLAGIMTVSVSFLAGCGGEKAKESTTPAPGNIPQQQTPENEKKALSDLMRKGLANNEMSYELVIVGPGNSTNSTIWLKDKKIKASSVVNGQQTVSIFDMDKKEIVTYLPNEKSATKMALDDYPGMENTTPQDYDKLATENDFQLAGTETLNGLKCNVITFNNGADGQTKMWLNSSTGIIAKVEQKIEGQLYTMEYKNVKSGPGSVPADAFDLPSGIKVLDINQMMKNLPSSAK